MLPVPLSLPVSQLLSRCNQHYASLTKSTSHKSIRAKKIFVHDLFEIVDHRQLVSECFTDFMQVTVTAILKLKDEVPVVVKAPAVSLPVPEPASKQPPAGKKFTREPSLMSNFIQNLKSESKLSHDAVKLTETPKRQKLTEKSEAKKVSSSPEKESKNARKKRERKELEKKLQSSASKRRQSESLSDSEDEVEKAKGEESNHDAFIRSISQSIQSYSLEEASKATSDSNVE